MVKNIKKQLVFIDDSGDPGFKGRASSPVFVMAGAVIMSSEVASRIDKEITGLKEDLGWGKETEVKFRKSSKEVRMKFLELINKFEFDIYAVYINKTRYPTYFEFSDNENLYNWVTKELLEMIPLKRATIKVDGRYGNKYKLRTRSYIRKNVARSEVKIKSFDVQDSKINNLIQLADLIAGAINRYLAANKADSGEYIKIIKKKIIELKELDLNRLELR